mgnify:CR=1 FL=1
MPSLDLTPAQTTEELEGMIDYCLDWASKSNNKKYGKDAYDLYAGFAKEYTIELSVAKTLAGIRESIKQTGVEKHD